MLKHLFISILMLCLCVPVTRANEIKQLPLSFYKDHRGIVYILYPTGEPTSYSTLNLWVNVGALHGGTKFRGVAHLVEHLVCNRVQLGPDFSISSKEIAFTAPLATVYRVYNLPIHNLKKALDHFLTIPKFKLTDAEVEKEKGVILSEFRYRYSNLSDRPAFYVGTGLEQDIHNFSSNLAGEFMNRFYPPNKNWIFIIGYPEKTLDKIISDLGLQETSEPDAFVDHQFSYAYPESSYAYDTKDPLMMRIPVELDSPQSLSDQYRCVESLFCIIFGIN